MPEGKKFDQGKPDWSLLPWGELEEVVKVLTAGKEKYGANNWQMVDSAHDRYFSAAMRHLTAWKIQGEKDPESGFSHLAHAVCNLLFLMWFDNVNANDEPRMTVREAVEYCLANKADDWYRRGFREENNK
jgi:hypothetical protein